MEYEQILFAGTCNRDLCLHLQPYSNCQTPLLVSRCLFLTVLCILKSNFFHQVFLLLRLFTLPQCRTYTPGTYNPNAHGSDTYTRSNRLWTRTLDRYTRAGLPECVVSRMSGPLPKKTQDRTQSTHTQSQDINSNF